MEGQTVGMTVFSNGDFANGELHILLNGVDIGTLWENLPIDQPLYGIFGLENLGSTGASFLLTGNVSHLIAHDNNELVQPIFVVGCPSGHFQCSNCYCTPDYNECNGRNDCGDNSDENHCSKTWLLYDIVF